MNYRPKIINILLYRLSYENVEETTDNNDFDLNREIGVSEFKPDGESFALTLDDTISSNLFKIHLQWKVEFEISEGIPESEAEKDILYKNSAEIILHNSSTLISLITQQAGFIPPVLLPPIIHKPEGQERFFDNDGE